MNKKVTIKDVAEAAGVCKATVSYVLNDRKDQKISEETKKKVWQVVNMLGYRPNAFAQNMRTAVARAHRRRAADVRRLSSFRSQRPRTGDVP